MPNYNVPTYYNLPSDLLIATGGSNIGHIQKFGFSDAIGDTERTIWDGAATTNCNYPSVAAPINVSSDHALDRAAGVGAREVIVSGLDGNFKEISEPVILDGTTPVTTEQSFIRCNRQDVGRHTDPDAVNAGSIYAFTGTATAGVPDDPAQIYSIISPGLNQSLQCNYTIPANRIGLIGFMEVSQFGNPGAEATVRALARPFGGVWQTKRKFVITLGSISRRWLPPLPIPAKTDIEGRAIRSSGGGNVDISAEFDMLLVPSS